MSRLKLILSLVALSGLALVAVLQYENLAKLRAENELLRGELNDLSHADVARAEVTLGTTESSTQAQLSELLKLRGEVTQLREQTKQVGALKEANEKLAASLREMKASLADLPKKKGPEDALPQDVHPKETWAFRGYGTPEATIESFFWATVNGDAAMTLDAYGPKQRIEMEKAMAKTQERTKDPHFATDEAEFAAQQKNVSEFRILDRRQVSDVEMVVTIYTVTRLSPNGNDMQDTGNLALRKIDGQWRLTGSPPR